MVEDIIGVYDAVSVGVVCGSVKPDEAGMLSLMLMQKRGGRYVKAWRRSYGQKPPMPVHIERNRLEIEMTNELPTLETFGDVETHWNLEDGGPYELVERDDGVLTVREQEGA